MRPVRYTRGARHRLLEFLQVSFAFCPEQSQRVSPVAFLLSRANRL